MLIIHNERILDFARSRYSAQDVRQLWSFLEQQGTLDFPILDTGLFSAARLAASAEYTGYGNVWVRDNIHVAHAHWIAGDAGVAVRNVQALLRYFQRHRSRFDSIIHDEADPDTPMNRPHIRFNGRTMEENPEKWPQAQNDALGYFLWLYCKLVRAGQITLQPDDWEILGLFPLYFQVIRYWEDEDSGCWEEMRKIEASSVGVVAAALIEMRGLMSEHSLSAFPCSQETVTIPLLDDLILQGRSALTQILPYECIQSDPGKIRRCDAALLFLIYPLQIVDDAQADQILQDVETQLQGDYGIRRYLGDSYWCADYKKLQKPEQRTSDVSDDMSARNALLKPGQEAQWCLFDPTLSTIYGCRYQTTGEPADLDKQTHYFHRSLGQLTGPGSGFEELLCPEAYCLEQGQYGPNDVTPLLWTQANLLLALKQMEQSAQCLSEQSA